MNYSTSIGRTTNLYTLLEVDSFKTAIIMLVVNEMRCK